jgi:hypothetical protein
LNQDLSLKYSQTKLISLSRDPSKYSHKNMNFFITFSAILLINVAKISAMPAPDGSPLEYGNYFQGDMMLTDEQREYFLSNDTEINEEEEKEGGDWSQRTGLKDEKYRWPKNDEGQVIVPYIIDEESEFCELVSALFFPPSL